ncbi:hypothetical protein MASSI9I_20559 [Massilia sp. 9I]|nr:hypothetical protein MASSI9I_20559 [Massilia sp. 9I]
MYSQPNQMKALAPRKYGKNFD